MHSLSIHGLVFRGQVSVDSSGNLVIVELKRGKAPREVVAQLLEYAAWANDLSDEQLFATAERYFSTRQEFKDADFTTAFRDMFETEEPPVLSQRLRLFVLAEEIPPAVSRVCRFLRTSHGIDVTCIDVSTFTTESGEVLVSTEIKVGDENIVAPKNTGSPRWSGEQRVKQVVWDAVQELTHGNTDFIFAPKDVTEIILKKHYNFNKSTVGCQLIADCVNHTSRHHYPGGDDRYWWIEKGRYRLYDRNKDKVTTQS